MHEDDTSGTLNINTLSPHMLPLPQNHPTPMTPKSSQPAVYIMQHSKSYPTQPSHPLQQMYTPCPHHKKKHQTMVDSNHPTNNPHHPRITMHPASPPTYSRRPIRNCNQRLCTVTTPDDPQRHPSAHYVWVDNSGYKISCGGQQSLPCPAGACPRQTDHG